MGAGGTGALSGSAWLGSGMCVGVARCAALPRASPDGAAEAPAARQYRLLRIAGDGRCLFRSLAQGGHIAAQHDGAAGAAGGGQPVQLLGASEETAAADKLRSAICDELLRRRCVPAGLGC